MTDKPGFLESLSPWTSRSNTPKAVEGSDGKSSPSAISSGQKQAIYHSISHRYRVSTRDYPSDCPTLHTRWFYAVDVCFHAP